MMETINALTAIVGTLLQLGYFIYAMVCANKCRYQQATFYMAVAIFFLLVARLM